MKHRYIVIMVAALAFSTSCIGPNSSSNSASDQLPEIMVVSEDSFMKAADITTVEGEFGVYQNLLKEADATIGISSSRHSPFDKERIVAFYTSHSSLLTKSGNTTDMKDLITVNGKELFAPSTKSGSGSVRALFGNNITFGIRNGETKAKSESSSANIYAPQIVRIEFPSEVATEEYPTPLCYYSDFVVRWNADTGNDNGVILAVEWSGIMSFGEDYPDTRVQHLACFPDTGETTLEESMFDDVPDGACCSLWIFRGDVNMMEDDGTDYQVLAESHDKMDFILVRYIAQE